MVKSGLIFFLKFLHGQSFFVKIRFTSKKEGFLNKFSNKNDLLCAWCDFKKILDGQCPFVVHLSNNCNSVCGGRVIWVQLTPSPIFCFQGPCIHESTLIWQLSGNYTATFYSTSSYNVMFITSKSSSNIPPPCPVGCKNHPFAKKQINFK